MLEIVRRIGRAVAVPVTADMEAGYGDSLAEVRDMTRCVDSFIRSWSLAELLRAFRDVWRMCARFDPTHGRSRNWSTSRQTSVLGFDRAAELLPAWRWSSA